LISSGQLAFVMSGWKAQPDLRHLFIPTNEKTHPWACICDVRLKSATWPTPFIHSDKWKNSSMSMRLWCQVEKRNLTYAIYSFRQMEKLIREHAFVMSGPTAGPGLRHLFIPTNGKTYLCANVRDVRLKSATWPTPTTRINH